MKLLRFRGNLLVLLPILFLLGLGCSIVPRYAAPTVAPIVIPPPPFPTPEICSETTPDLAVQILYGRRDADGQRITVNGTGFLPGEKITIRVTGQSALETSTTETTGYPVQVDGTFSDMDTLQLDHPHMHWEVRVIHQRGIACLQFTTP